jgi:hypothetical protein
MRLFQNAGVYPAYRDWFDGHAASSKTFESRLSAFLYDRFGSPHILEPVYKQDPAAFFTNGDDEILQRLWAKSAGMSGTADMAEILLAQIEHHRTEVFYNLDPMRYTSAFIRRLPACVKVAIAWRAAPSPGVEFEAYDRVVCNFPSILESYRKAGWKAEWFAPSHDPEMAPYAQNESRPIDVLFVGGYSRHHRRRAEILEAVAHAFVDRSVVYHLDQSRLTRLAESPLGLLPPIRHHRRPTVIRRVSQSPVFGRELYSAISKAKIVLNGAVDMAGSDRGNMRCFEAMGCGALMVSDTGSYPPGMRDGETLLAYGNAEEAVRLIAAALADPARARQLAKAGTDMLRTDYGKSLQWEAFQRLVEAI